MADGDVLYAGSSNFSGWGLAKRQLQAWQRGFVGFVSEQTQYNLLSRVPEMEVLPAAQDFGIGVLVYMPLAGGLLTGKTKSLDGTRTRAGRGGVRDQPRPGEPAVRRLLPRCVERSANRSGSSPPPGRSHHPAVASAIVGVRTVDQLDGLDRAAALHLDAEVMDRLNEIFDINDGRRIGQGRSPEAHSW